MSKFKKNAFVEQYKASEREKEKQAQLHKKYSIDDEIKIVEKSNMAKFTINTIARIIKALAGVVIIILAVVGIYSIVITEIRQPLLENLNQIWQYIINTINF